MASFSQPPFFSSLIPINNKTLAFSPQVPNNFLTFKSSKISSSNAESSSDVQENPEESQPQESQADVDKQVPLAVKLALEKAKEYRKSKSLAPKEGDASKIASSVESAEMDKKNNGFTKRDEKLAPGLKEGNEKSPEEKQPIKKSGKKDKLTVSKIDFMGLNFSDKKSGRDLPAGLRPLSDPFPEGDLPEVEILIGDMTKFGSSKQIPIQEDDDTELYKPKVSTWGVFPRPGDISKTYGGGRTIRPGDKLETEEEKAAKQARTRQLLSAYMTKIGMKIDPKLRAECQKALNDGDELMDLGKLKEALPFYETVMEKLVFQSELHGLAALQWSICQDSLGRSSEARTMYERLQTHPSPQVGKKARQLFSSFEAMEFMKVNTMNRIPLSKEYQSYFEAFVKDKKTYPLKETEMEDEDVLDQALPYVIFLLFPIIMVFILAASKSQ